VGQAEFILSLPSFFFLLVFKEKKEEKRGEGAGNGPTVDKSKPWDFRG
jgi:hypothetical protein